MNLFAPAPRWTRWPLVGLIALACLVIGASEAEGAERSTAAKLFREQAAKAQVEAAKAAAVDGCPPTRLVIQAPDGSEYPADEIRITRATSASGQTVSRVTWTAPVCLFQSSFEGDPPR